MFRLQSKTPAMQFGVGKVLGGGALIGGGALAGAGYGSIGGSIAGHKERKRFQEELQKGKAVNSSKYLKAHGVRYVGDFRDIKPGDFTPLQKHALPQLLGQVHAGRNAFAHESKQGNRFVVAGRKVPEQVLAHEVGHIKDFRKHGRPKWHERGIFGLLGGGALKREKAAWAESGVPTNEDALATYKKMQTGTRIGVAAGAALGALGAHQLAKFKLSRKGKLVQFASGDIFRKYAPDSIWNTDPLARQVSKAATARTGLADSAKSNFNRRLMRNALVEANYGGEHTEYLKKIKPVEKEIMAAKRRGKTLPPMRIEGPMARVSAKLVGQPEGGQGGDLRKLRAGDQIRVGSDWKKVKPGSMIATERMGTPREWLQDVKRKYRKEIDPSSPKSQIRGAMSRKISDARAHVRQSMADELRLNRSIIQGVRKVKGTLPQPLTEAQWAKVKARPITPATRGYIPEKWEPKLGGMNIGGEYVTKEDWKEALPGLKTQVKSEVDREIVRRTRISSQIHANLTKRASENIQRARSAAQMPQLGKGQLHTEVKKTLHGIYGPTGADTPLHQEGIAARLGLKNPRSVERIRDMHMNLARWAKTAKGEQMLAREIASSGSPFRPKPAPAIEEFPRLKKIPGFKLLRKALKFSAAGVSTIYFERKRKSFIEKAQENPHAASEKIYTGISRGSRVLRDINLPKAGNPIAGNVIDERGRERKPEWRKPWAIRAVATAAIGAFVARKRLVPFARFAGRETTAAVLNKARKLPGTLRPRVSTIADETNRRVPAFSKVFTNTRREIKGIAGEVKEVKNKISEGTWGKLPSQQKKAARAEEIRKAQEVRDEKHAKLRRILEEGGVFQSKSKPITFAQVQPDWDIRDARGKSVRVYAPGSQTRTRRPKKWHEKKANRDLITAALLPVVGAGGAGAYYGIDKLIERIKRPGPQIKPVAKNPARVAGVVEGKVARTAAKNWRTILKLSSGLRTIKFNMDPQKKTFLRDSAVGGLEGGVGFLATERLLNRLQQSGRFFKNPLAKFGTAVIAGGLGTAASGIAVNRLIRKKRAARKAGSVPGDSPGSVSELKSKMKTIKFDSEGYNTPYPPTKGKRLTVAQDRYRKKIREQEINRHESNLAKSAIWGGALGAMLRRTPHAAVTGALIGTTAQAGLILSNRSKRDVWGDSTISTRRTERLPYQAAAIGTGALLGRKLYRNLHGLNARLDKIINFEEHQPRGPHGEFLSPRIRDDDDKINKYLHTTKKASGYAGAAIAGGALGTIGGALGKDLYEYIKSRRFPKKIALK